VIEEVMEETAITGETAGETGSSRIYPDMVLKENIRFISGGVCLVVLI
jgi:hypothetical protein